MKTRLLVLSSLALLLGCDKVERDWGKCNSANECKDNHNCVRNKCVAKDAGLDAPLVFAPTDAGTDGPSSRGASADGAPGTRGDAADLEPDAPVASLDAPTDVAFDTPVGDGPRACDDDRDCPNDLPLCFSSTCVQCRSHDDCTNQDAGADDQDAGSEGVVTRGALCNVENRCVGCLSHADCRDPKRPVCSEAQTCVACGAAPAPDDACAARTPALPICLATTGACVQCVRASDCKPGDAGVKDGGGAGGTCSARNTCVECNSNSDCTTDPARAFCLANACVGCGTAGAKACTDDKPVCASSGSKAGQCVECTSNAQCLQAASPLCEANQCRGCKKDSECSAQAGICALDGSCPKPGAIVYAQVTSKCTSSDRGRGTLDFPYCDLDKAVSTALQSGSVVRLKGTITSSKALVIDASERPLLISGQAASTAIINAPADNSDPVISITGGEVNLRDLTVAGGRATGLSVSAGTLRVTRCYVLDNADNGIAVGDGVAFDISNTVVAGNTRTGVTLGAYTGTGTVRFAFNTVVNNGYGGVVCPAMGRAITGVLANNNGVFDINPNCITDSTTSTAAPGLAGNFHLSATSPCVNAGGSSCPIDDIDGEARPKDKVCDCGADEL